MQNTNEHLTQFADALASNDDWDLWWAVNQITMPHLALHLTQPELHLALTAAEILEKFEAEPELAAVLNGEMVTSATLFVLFHELKATERERVKAFLGFRLDRGARRLGYSTFFEQQYRCNHTAQKIMHFLYADRFSTSMAVTHFVEHVVQNCPGLRQVFLERMKQLKWQSSTTNLQKHIEAWLLGLIEQELLTEDVIKGMLLSLTEPQTKQLVAMNIVSAPTIGTPNRQAKKRT